MKNSQLPASPLASDEHVYSLFAGEELAAKSIGLTKREEFARSAMQGILSNSTLKYEATAKDISEIAVMYADALLAELERTK